MSEYQKVKVNKDDWLMLSVIYFQNPLSNCDSSEKVLKSFKEVGLAKSEKKLHPYFSEDPKCYIFSKSSQQMWLSEKATKCFKKVNLAKSWKKLQPSISEDSKCYIFLTSSELLWLKLKGSKVFQGGWPCQVWKEASSLFLLKPQVLYIIEILSVIVTQWEVYQVL